ncbi:TPA: hypothetical protein QEM76_002200 [Pseudomonas putida]|uniref:hypothetical protein n=1 Tax=Pseudomonas putida TaxID=303 RepID=UPI00235DA2FF|nr:hypothetical protein [Pseudomonas putida]GLO10125.1 hypothetical protein PPUJ20005_40940 [Pseudomonas putida]HDS0986037.1 hypothetical protein [Pseudomonas putida]HDS1799573.1 hypothetical protein [Pseudomonas putida]HDS1805509.1 hypothetical protein [Pseudomonas putida]
MQITYSHIKQVKRLARELKAAHPALKLGQRQDLAAVEVLGVRNYHEAIRRYDQWLMLHVHVSPDPRGVSKCNFCDFSFAADLKEDREAHQKVHEKLSEASEAMGYLPANFMQREKMKSAGSNQALSDASLDARIDGVLLVLRGWFDRSLSSAIYGDYWRKHPSFEIYVSMIQDTLSHLYADLKPVLKARYGYRADEIRPGESNWYPKAH